MQIRKEGHAKRRESPIESWANLELEEEAFGKPKS